jgi:predicted metal-dependent phosphoesterase TrpH
MNPALPNIVDRNNIRKGGVKFADLHLHTDFSDSTYTPQALIDISKKKGLSCIAVTDHDTVDGIEPCLKAAKQDIEILPAIELTAEHNGLEVHILGYLIEYKNEQLIKKLNFLKQKRIERMGKIIKKLKDLNIEIKEHEIQEFSGRGTIGRLHLARLMLKKGYINSLSEAFQKYIGDKSPAYICGFHLNPQEAIKLIEDVQGIAVLAHPYSLDQDDLIPLFVSYGLKGLEVYYPEHSPQQTAYYENLAGKYNLLITGGSDCHGDAKPEAKIGSIKIPYELVERLKKVKR